MQIGALIIGDEILTGKRQDKHFAFLRETLGKLGLELSWTLYVGDDAYHMQRFLKLLLHSDDLILSFGGIGATPDDLTRTLVAQVLNRPLEPHPEAVACIEKQFGASAYPHRILMADLPAGAELIPNPINQVPGFAVGHAHFMPGFPEMSWPMVQWIFDHKYPHLRQLAPSNQAILFVTRGRESDLLPLMQRIVADFPSLRFSSLPHLGDPPHIEITLRGDDAQVTLAFSRLQHGIEAQGLAWQLHPPKA